MEYEYSFHVSDIKPYLDYCKSNNYKLIGHINQTRTLYRNKNKTMARITIEKGKQITKLLDFKEDKLGDEVLKVRKESKTIKFNNLKNCESILEFLDYKKDNTLVRNRYTYVWDEVKFEIDDYISPEKMYVVAIEGNKEKVDAVYKNLKTINQKYKI